MDGPVTQGNRTPNRDINGLIVQTLFGYLGAWAPAGSIERVLQLSGDARPIADLSDAATWTTYAQFRSLLEAAGEVLGGSEHLSQIGLHVYDSIQSPELFESLSVFSTPSDLYAAMPSLTESIAPITELRTESTGPNECRIAIRFKDGYAPFPENCAFTLGLHAAVPRLFGFRDAQVVHESCQCDGAPWCQALMRWEADSDAVRASRAELAAQASQARLEELHNTVAQLVSGDSLEVVLTQVMAAAARAVPALSYILAVTPSARADRWLCSDGVDGPECAAIIEHVGGSGSETSTNMCAIEVISDRNRYGHLIAVRALGLSFGPIERSILKSYGRLAASALDSEASISEARQQATTAQALLSLSSSLADLTSTQEMILRLAHAVPSVVDCDRVAIWVTDPSGLNATMGASHGYGDAFRSELSCFELPPAYANLHSEVFRHDLGGASTVLTSALAEAGAAAALSFPIIYDSEMYGWITVDVTNQPKRLDDNGDITERLRGLAGQAAIAVRNARLLDEIRHQALHDSLTGLPNRVLVLDRVNQILARARREHFELATLFIDLDGFKDINDTFGHAVGDKLLKAVAERFAGTLRQSDTVARLGGDEFVVVVEGISLAAGPELVAQRLLNVMIEPFHLGNDAEISARISASIGIASGMRDSAEDLLRDADIALYSAKEAGKNRFVVFEDEMHTALRIRHELEMDLREAIGSQQFSLLYQPIFELSGHSVVGVEAVLRWQHPTRGVLSPDEFIPALEASGLVTPVGRWVLNEACRQAMMWQQAGLFTKLSVNVSARQFDADTLLKDVQGALDASGLPPDDLIIEITETSLMRNIELAQKQLKALKSLGVRIAIDDFGAGYSSLGYLQTLPVDSLKIDRSFISEMATSSEGRALIHTLLQLGKAMHLETLAEGIEESGQLTHLQVQSCDAGQGFLFSRPMESDQVEAFFKPAPAIS
jgi:diguanylate cyclase (GGDEF)-like protein